MQPVEDLDAPSGVAEPHAAVAGLDECPSWSPETTARALLVGAFLNSRAAREAGAAAEALRYAVIADGPEWRVLTGRRRIGPFPEREAALAVAAKLAAQALEAGREAELYAQGEGGDFAIQPIFRPDSAASVSEPPASAG